MAVVIFLFGWLGAGGLNPGGFGLDAGCGCHGFGFGFGISVAKSPRRAPILEFYADREFAAVDKLGGYGLIQNQGCVVFRCWNNAAGCDGVAHLIWLVGRCVVQLRRLLHAV